MSLAPFVSCSVGAAKTCCTYAVEIFFGILGRLFAGVFTDTEILLCDFDHRFFYYLFQAVLLVGFTTLFCFYKVV